MKTTMFFRSAGVWAVAISALIQPTISRGQYTQNKISTDLDVSAYPSAIQQDYRLYRERCAICHELGGVTRKLLSAPAQQRFWVEKMKAMPSTYIADQEAGQVLEFLNYEATHRATGPTTGGTPEDRAKSPLIAEGRQFFKAQGCEDCHSVNGNDTLSLTKLVRTKTHQQLAQKMNALRANSESSMPPLPPDTSDRTLEALVAYLQSLKAGD